MFFLPSYSYLETENQAYQPFCFSIFRSYILQEQSSNIFGGLVSYISTPVIYETHTNYVPFTRVVASGWTGWSRGTPNQNEPQKPTIGLGVPLCSLSMGFRGSSYMSLFFIRFYALTRKPNIPEVPSQGRIIYIFFLLRVGEK